MKKTLLGAIILATLFIVLNTSLKISNRIIYTHDAVYWLPKNIIKRPINYKKLNSSLFTQKAEEICNKINCKPTDLLTIMTFETLGSLSSHQQRIGPGQAIGLIQFLPTTAKSLGSSMIRMNLMGDKRQLDYVSQYFLQIYNARHIQSKQPLQLNDLYMFVFYPAAIQKNDDYILFRKEDGNAYLYNHILDTSKKGFITKHDIGQRVEQIKVAINTKKPYLFVEMRNGMQYSLFTDLVEGVQKHGVKKLFQLS